MHVRVFVRAFSSIYILLDYPRTRVRFVREFSPLPSPTHPLRLLTLTLTLGPSHPLTLISDPIDWFSSPDRPFSNATSPTYHLHTFNLKPAYEYLYTRCKLFFSRSFLIPHTPCGNICKFVFTIWSILFVSNVRIIYIYLDSAFGS